MSVMCYLFIPQEMQEARKSFSKKDEDYLLSGRDKRLAEQVSSYNVSQRIKCITFLFLYPSFHALLIFSSFSCFSFFYMFFVSSHLFLYICSEKYSAVYIYIHTYMYNPCVGFFNASLNIFRLFFFCLFVLVVFF